MASESSSQERIELVIPADDLILPFQADQADVVGRLVKLGPVVDTILSRHDYPEPVSQLLGEAVALTALLGAALKFEGKFILQASTDGPVDLLVADYQVPGQLARLCALLRRPRRCARRRRWCIATARPRSFRHDHRPRLGDGALSGRGSARRRKPDRGRRHLFPPVRAAPDLHPLAVAKHYRAGQAERPWTWRAGGLLVQKLTREGGHGPSVGDFEEEDWMRARALAETVEDHELLDPLLPPDRLLYRLFHEEQVRAYPAINLETYCSCSRERVEELLRRFTSEDLKDMVVDGEVWVTCEFCNSRYRFDPASFTKSDDAVRRPRIIRHGRACPGHPRLPCSDTEIRGCPAQGRA